MPNNNNNKLNNQRINKPNPLSKLDAKQREKKLDGKAKTVPNDSKQRESVWKRLSKSAKNNNTFNQTLGALRRATAQNYAKNVLQQFKAHQQRKDTGRKSVRELVSPRTLKYSVASLAVRKTIHLQNTPLKEIALTRICSRYQIKDYTTCEQNIKRIMMNVFDENQKIGPNELNSIVKLVKTDKRFPQLKHRGSDLLQEMLNDVLVILAKQALVLIPLLCKVDPHTNAAEIEKKLQISCASSPKKVTTLTQREKLDQTKAKLEEKVWILTAFHEELKESLNCHTTESNATGITVIENIGEPNFPMEHIHNKNKPNSISKTVLHGTQISENNGNSISLIKSDNDENRPINDLVPVANGERFKINVAQNLQKLTNLKPRALQVVNRNNSKSLVHSISMGVCLTFIFLILFLIVMYPEPKIWA